MLLQGFPQSNVKSILAYPVWSQTKARNKRNKSEEGTSFNKVGLDFLAPLLLFCFLDPISNGKKKQQNYPQTQIFLSITPPYNKIHELEGSGCSW